MLVEITPEKHGVMLEIAYGSTANFTGRPVYQRAACFLHPAAEKCLKEAIRLAEALGYQIKIFDGFRPLEAQQALWHHTPDPDFISPPDTGRTPHCRGVAVDLTLTNAQGEELDMGTAFDAFTPLSYHGVTDISPKAQANRHLLMGIMTFAGWQYNPKEWWHYQLPEVESYPRLTDKEANTALL